MTKSEGSVVTSPDRPKHPEDASWLVPSVEDHKTFVQAEGKLAEHLCNVHLLDLTPERAGQLRNIHAEHRPDDCLVHLAAAYLLLGEDCV
ncbi:hypothetical protein [Nocardia gamkensis]|uniref:Uncharacterized protein n=1 Tax=Nocardia gamkensis TaxID=352869 RepID=A0A7X6L800_9NOCA|nr:hypothetical protein [Nocardia gamkensis]NKY29553.1 hypothetical protein [Nocardia gamkensis]